MKRAIRRQNHIARDLWTPKYRKRIEQLEEEDVDIEQEVDEYYAGDAEND